MAIFEIKTEENKDVLELFRKLNYITDCCSTKQALIYGSAVSTTDTYEEMILVKKIFNQMDRNAFMHYVLSIEKDEKIALLIFKDIAIEICELISNFCGNYQVLMAVHINTDNLHVHYVANTIDYLTGERFDLNRRRLEEIKYQINGILQIYGISTIRMKSFYTTDNKIPHFRASP